MQRLIWIVGLVLGLTLGVLSGGTTQAYAATRTPTTHTAVYDSTGCNDPSSEPSPDGDQAESAGCDSSISVNPVDVAV